MTISCKRHTMFLLPAMRLTTAILLFQVPPPVFGFGQGAQIQANFGIYCNRPASQRLPVHFDMSRCRGYCTPQTDARNMFAMQVNATSYFRDSVQVSVLANPRGGFSNNIRGFALIAMTEDERIVGSFREEPDALIASCDPLLEGDTAFHAQASFNRRSLALRWRPGSRNYGTVRFRAWIVVQHNDIYILDSHPLENEVTGTEELSLEENFNALIMRVFNISTSAATIVNDNDDDDDDDDDDGNTSGIGNTNPDVKNNTTQSLSSQNSTGSVLDPAPSTTPDEKVDDALDNDDDDDNVGDGEDDDDKRDKDDNRSKEEDGDYNNNNNSNISNINNSNNNNSSNNSNVKFTNKNTNSKDKDSTITVIVALSSDDGDQRSSVTLTLPTLTSFEQAFQRRLMTTSLDANDQNPFESLNQPLPTFSELFPPPPPPTASPLSAPFAPPPSGSAFSPRFGSRGSDPASSTGVSTTTRIRQTFNQLVPNLAQLPGGSFRTTGTDQVGNRLGGGNRFGSLLNPFGNMQSGGLEARNANQNGNVFGGGGNQFGSPQSGGFATTNTNQNGNQFGGGNQFGSLLNPFGNLQSGGFATTNTNQNGNQFGGGNQFRSLSNEFEQHQSLGGFGSPNTNQNGNQFGDNQLGSRLNPFGQQQSVRGGFGSQTPNQNPNPFSKNRFGNVNSLGQQSNRANAFGFPDNTNNAFQGFKTNTGQNRNPFVRTSNSGGGFGFQDNNNPNGLGGENFSRQQTNNGFIFGFPTNENAFRRPGASFSTGSGNSGFQNFQTNLAQFSGSSERPTNSFFGESNHFSASPSSVSPHPGSVLNRFSHFFDPSLQIAAVSGHTGSNQQNVGGGFSGNHVQEQQNLGNTNFERNPENNAFATQRSGGNIQGQHSFGNNDLERNSGNDFLATSSSWNNFQGQPTFGNNNFENAWRPQSFFGQNSGRGRTGQLNSGNAWSGQQSPNPFSPQRFPTSNSAQGANTAQQVSGNLGFPRLQFGPGNLGFANNRFGATNGNSFAAVSSFNGANFLNGANPAASQLPNSNTFNSGFQSSFGPASSSSGNPQNLKSSLPTFFRGSPGQPGVGQSSAFNRFAPTRTGLNFNPFASSFGRNGAPGVRNQWNSFATG